MLLKVRDYEKLEEESTEHLERHRGTSFRGFFYLGISLYKMEDYGNAILAFQKSELINSEDAQL